MIKMSYQIEGIHYDTLLQAVTIATRLFLRYDKMRDIEIYEVDHHGDKHLYETLFATKEYNNRDPDTIDWVGE